MIDPTREASLPRTLTEIDRRLHAVEMKSAIPGATGGTGSQGPAGPAGADGQDGEDGRTLLSGTVDPTAGDGADGDFFINTATSTLFGPKAAGAWPAGVSLIGADGADGAQGPAGPAGADGQDGADGQTDPYSVIMITGGTGTPVTHPQLPQGGKFYYGPAIGGTLRATLTADGNSTTGLYSADATDFHPINALGLTYSTGLSASSVRGDYAVTNAWDQGVFSEFGNNSSSTTATQYIHTVSDTGVPLVLNTSGSDQAYDTVGSTVATAYVNNATLYQGASVSSGYNRDLFLGSTDQGVIYGVAMDNSPDRGYLCSWDLADAYNTTVTTGTPPDLSSVRLTKISKTGFYGSLPAGGFDGSFRMCTPWHGALTGKSYAWLCDASSNIIRVELATANIFHFNAGVGFSAGQGYVDHCSPIMIESTEWGDAQDSFLGLDQLDDGTGTSTNEWRIVKFGAWGYTDVTPIGSGSALPWNLRAYPVPVDENDAMYSGGKPSQITMYSPNDGGTVVVNIGDL
jgi:hypothetical protein